MTKNRHQLHTYAMYCGTYLGIFWIVKFIFLPLALSYSFCMFLFVALTIGVPFIGYAFLKAYRDKVCGGEITFLNGWLFTVFMYMFASLLTAVAHYIYFRYLDQGYFMEKYEMLVQTLLAADVSGMEVYRDQLEAMISEFRSVTPIDLTINMLSRNVFFGSILAIPTAWVARRRKNPGLESHT
ncbi:MAG: DUF4199 domain-containing protein [Bacteroides sp.]|nr:DUF4199 domain-containing protein [Bacteroides sp.]